MCFLSLKSTLNECRIVLLLMQDLTVLFLNLKLSWLIHCIFQISSRAPQIPICRGLWAKSHWEYVSPWAILVKYLCCVLLTILTFAFDDFYFLFLKICECFQFQMGPQIDCMFSSSVLARRWPKSNAVLWHSTAAVQKSEINLPALPVPALHSTMEKFLKYIFT